MPKAGMHYRKRLELSDRQREVLRLMARGRTNFEIARALDITLDGAKYHVSEILAKLDASTREEAVETWREYNQPGARVARLAGGVAGVFAAMPAAAKLAGAVAVIVVAVAGAVALWPQQETDEVRAAPETPEELLKAMADVLGEDGQVLELQAAWTVEEMDGERQEYGSFQAWFAFAEEKGRIEYSKGPDNSTDTPEAQTVWFDGADYYEQGPDDDRPRSGLLHERWAPCLDTEQQLAVVIACGLQPSAPNLQTSNVRLLRDTDWDGRPALGIAFDQVQDIQRQAPRGSPPTPTPGAGTPSVAPEPNQHTMVSTYEFLVDASSYLPLGLRARATRDGKFVGSIAIEYRARLFDKNNFDASVFDPRGAGFRKPSEEELDLLDNPAGGGPVYWLEREFEFDAGRGPDRLRLVSVEQRYHPERPSLITLYYEGGSGAVSIVVELWAEGAWQGFLAHLQDFDNNSGHFPFGEACTEVQEFAAAGHRARVLHGYDYERREPPLRFGTRVPNPPTPTPFPPKPCPETPHNEFMVEVYIDGYVVTLNAPIGIFELGESYEAYDSPEQLMAIAAGLRERQDGE